MPLNKLTISSGYDNNAPAAVQRINGAQVDSDHRAMMHWANNTLVPALQKVIRDDDTLEDETVRMRNLHPEVIVAMASSGDWSFKEAVAAATTANITLSGEQTIDGVMTSGSRVLVKNQTQARDNGVYVSSGGAWSRATDCDTAADLGYAYVAVSGGSENGGTWWIVTDKSSSISLGSSPITFAQVGGSKAKRYEVNVMDWGVYGDNIHYDSDAINRAIAAGVSAGWEIVFPGKFYKCDKSIQFPSGDNKVSVRFQGCTFNAVPGGVYNQIKNGAGVNLGIYVIFDYANTIYSTFRGFFTVVGINGENHAGVSCSIQNTGYLNQWDGFACHTCEEGLYGASNGGSVVAGSVTGNNFSLLDFQGCNRNIYLDINQDDIYFGTIRSNTGNGSKYQFHFETPVHVISFYMNGASVTKPGILIGTTSFTADNVFVEGDFSDCIVVSNKCLVDIRHLRPSFTFSTADGVIIKSGSQFGSIRAGLSTITANNTSVEAVVGLYNQANSCRNIRLTYPFPITERSPVKYLGGVADTSDNIVVETQEDGDWYFYYKSGSIIRRKITQGYYHRTWTSYNGLFASTVGYEAPHNAIALSVSSGTYSITDLAKPASLVEFQPTSAGLSIGLFNGYPEHAGHRVTLVTSGHDLTINATGGVGTNIVFADGATSKTLKANRTSSLTLAWDGTRWVQVAECLPKGRNCAQSGGETAASIGGDGNDAQGYASTVRGISAKAVNTNEHSSGIGLFSTPGDCQMSEMSWYGITGDGVTKEIKINGDAGSAVATMPPNTIWVIDYTVSCFSNAGDMACFRRTVSAKRWGAAFTWCSGSPVTIGTDWIDAGLSGISFNLSYDAFTTSIRVNVTGKTGVNIRWVVYAKLMQVSR